MIMLLELMMVFGFVMPALLPMTAVAMFLHALAFEVCVKHQGATLKFEARPPFRFLWVSLGLGAGLVLWMFVECELAGRNLVFVGVPVSAVLGGLTPALLTRWHSLRTIHAPDLQESLLHCHELLDETHPKLGACVEAGSRDRAQTQFFDSAEAQPELEGCVEASRDRALTQFFEIECMLEMES